MWALLDLSPWRIAVAIAWGVLALGSGLGLAALAAWLIARAWQMPPVLDLSVAVVAVRALGISRGLCRYLERLATHDVALRAMTTARTTVYRTLARSDIWMRRAMRGGSAETAAATTDERHAGSARKRPAEFLGPVGDPGTDVGITDSAGVGPSEPGRRRVARSDKIEAAGASVSSERRRVPETGSASADGGPRGSGGAHAAAFLGPVGDLGTDVGIIDSAGGVSGGSGRAGTAHPDTVEAAGASGRSGQLPATGVDGAVLLRRGDLLVRIGSDIDDLGAVVVRVFVPIAVAVVLSVAAVGLLATISVGAAAILAASLVVAGIVAPWLSGWAAREAERAVRADRAEFTAQVLTVLDHAPELRVAGKLDATLAAAQRAGQRAVAAADSAAARSAWAAAATPLSIGASVLGALLIGIAIYGPHGGAFGAMTPMALTILVLLPLSAFEAVAPLPAAAQALTTARAALHRLSVLDGAGSALPTARDRTAQQPFDHAANDRSANGHSRPARDLLSGNATGRTESDAGEMASGASARTDVQQPDRADAGADARGRGVRDLLSRSSAGRAEGGARGDGGGTLRDSRLSHGLGGEVNIDDGWAGDLLLGNLPARPEGRRMAVVGPSGAGKTTLLMAWAGLFDTPEPGVTFFAEDAHIFGTTVLENLRVARGDLTADEAEKALCAVGLGEWVGSLPDGVDTDLVGGAAAVSGGQRRRILLARALISPARVLLLDEPTEHLEAEAGAGLLRDLLDSASGLVEPDRIVVVVTHQLPSDHRADVVLRVNASGQVTTDFSADVGPAAPADSADREIPLPTH